MRLVLLCLAVLSSSCALVHGTGVVVSMTCPSRLVEEKVNSVTCRINTTEIENVGCVSPPSNVVFQIKGEINPLCTSFYTSSCNTSPDSIDEGSCECTEQTGDVKIYLFKFKGNATDYNETKLECTVCASSPEIQIPPSNCDSLIYGPKDVAGAAADGSEEEGSSSSGLIIGDTIQGPKDVAGAADGSEEEGSGSSGLIIGDTIQGPKDVAGAAYGSDETGSSLSGLIIVATVGGVVVVTMVIGTAMFCHKGRSSSGHNVHTNTRSDTPPPAVGPAGHPADRGVDVMPTKKEAEDNDSDASEASDVSLLLEELP